MTEKARNSSFAATGNTGCGPWFGDRDLVAQGNFVLTSAPGSYVGTENLFGVGHNPFSLSKQLNIIDIEVFSLID